MLHETLRSTAQSLRYEYELDGICENYDMWWCERERQKEKI